MWAVIRGWAFKVWAKAAVVLAALIAVAAALGMMRLKWRAQGAAKAEARITRQDAAQVKQAAQNAEATYQAAAGAALAVPAAKPPDPEKRDDFDTTE